MRMSLYLALVLVIPASVQAQNAACQAFDGALVLNSEDEVLGYVTSPYSAKSIFNKFGQYGSQFRSDSIWNKFGRNGSEFRSDSAFNKFSRTPPRLIKDGEIIGYLSVNRSLNGAINPIVLGAVCYEYEPD